VREGFEIAFGGPVPFERSGTELAPEAVAQVAAIAERLRGHTTKIEVKGHASAEAPTADAGIRDMVDLSYRRARTVADALIEGGVSPTRIRVVAAGDSEPLLAQAYDERRREINRRVEVIVRESLVAEYEGDDAGFEEE
jgi:chemotaxis protein MotB